MVHIRTALHVLTPPEPAEDAAFIFKFISSSRLPPNFQTASFLIVLVKADYSFYNRKTHQKTVAGRGPQPSASAPGLPYTSCHRLWVFMALPCPSWYNT